MITGIRREWNNGMLGPLGGSHYSWSWGKRACRHTLLLLVGPLQKRFTLDSRDQRIHERIIVRIPEHSWKKPWSRVWRPLEAKEPRNGGCLGVEGMIGKQGRRGTAAVSLSLGFCILGWQHWKPEAMVKRNSKTVFLQSDVPIVFQKPLQVLQCDEFLSQLAGDLGGFKYHFNYIL